MNWIRIIMEKAIRKRISEGYRFSKGGGHGAGQLRHFCKSHNLLSAIQEFGAEKIAREMGKGKFKG